MKTKKPRSPTRAQSAPAFWDSSAIIPLCCQQPQSPPARRSARVYDTQIVWWGTSVEIFSGIYRLTREGGLTVKESQAAVKALESLRHKWNEILPIELMIENDDQLNQTRLAMPTWNRRWPRSNASLATERGTLRRHG